MLETLLSVFMFYGVPSNYSGVVEALQKIAQQNPRTSQLVSLGISDTGDTIWGLKIGAGAVNDLIIATHHGNEYGSTAVALGAAEAFAQNPVDGHTVYVFPVLNISGFNRRSRYEQIGNSSIDDNRDYPGPCVTSSSFKSKATRALAAFIDRVPIVSSATLHTFSPAVLYPWGFSTSDVSTPYDSLFIKLSEAAAQDSHYEVGNSKEALYAADGTFEDYAFWKHGIWSLLFEMGFSHSPNSGEMDQMVAQNVPGLRRFFELAPSQRAENHAFNGACELSVRQRQHLE